MTNTNLTNIRIKSLYVLDQDEAVDFYCGKLGFVVADDIDLGFMRWLTVSLPHDPDHQLLLELPGGPMQDDQTAAQLRDLLTKGALGGTFLTTEDIDATFASLQEAGVEITQEPVEQPYGTDMAIRDPFGNHVRVSQMAPVSSEEVQRRYDAAQA
jgi:predicted enzyme related to lactoylglutathione lyase